MCVRPEEIFLGVVVTVGSDSLLGTSDGTTVGISVGLKVGTLLGCSVGVSVVGALVGSSVFGIGGQVTAEGALVGASEDGELVGEAEGMYDGALLG